MGLFEKKTCEHCGEKAGLLSRVKLSDGFLCGDCRKKLSSLSTGWRQRTYEDVKTHIAAREANRAKVREFQTTRKLGPQGEVELDEGRRQFLFALGRDYAEGNPEVFGYEQLNSFAVKESYDIAPPASEEDGDAAGEPQPAAPAAGIFKAIKQALDAAQSAALAAELKPFLKPVGSPLDPEGKKRPVQRLEAEIGVDHPFIESCSFPLAWFDKDDGQEALDAAYRQALDLMQALQALKAPAAAEAPAADKPAIPSPVQGVTGSGKPDVMAFCPACGAKNETGGAFCASCGQKLLK